MLRRGLDNGLMVTSTVLSHIVPRASCDQVRLTTKA
jgi:hypothetical protein